MPRVSVLLTCYNHLAYLPAAWGSIRSQTFQDTEVIAIDDGSTDGSRSWLEENASSAKLIFNASNLGTYGSLNRALEHATGEFVAVLNDDDVWLPEKLEKQLALLDAHSDVGLVHTDGHFIDGSDQKIVGSPLGFEFPRTRTGDVSLDLVYANKIIASAVLVRRKLLVELGGFDADYFGSGDWNMWLRVALDAHVGFVDDPLTLYRVHGANASHKLERIWRDDERLRKWIRTLEPRLREHAKSESDWRKAVGHNEACLGTVLKLNGRPFGAIGAYARSIRFQPQRWKSYLRLLAALLPVPMFRKLN